jgi:hypothetical protein
MRGTHPPRGVLAILKAVHPGKPGERTCPRAVAAGLAPYMAGGLFFVATRVMNSCAGVRLKQTRIHVVPQHPRVLRPSFLFCEPKK